MYVPTEEQEQRTLVEWLELHGVKYCHVPNGGARNRITGAKLKAQGVKRGVPDIMIFDPPPCGEYVGTAIELKRQQGGRLSPDQKRWLSILEDRGWYTAVCRGAGEAIELLEILGYGKLRRSGYGGMSGGIQDA